MKRSTEEHIAFIKSIRNTTDLNNAILFGQDQDGNPIDIESNQILDVLHQFIHYRPLTKNRLLLNIKKIGNLGIQGFADFIIENRIFARATSDRTLLFFYKFIHQYKKSFVVNSDLSQVYSAFIELRNLIFNDLLVYQLLHLIDYKLYCRIYGSNKNFKEPKKLVANNKGGVFKEFPPYQSKFEILLDPIVNIGDPFKAIYKFSLDNFKNIITIDQFEKLVETVLTIRDHNNKPAILMGDTRFECFGKRTLREYQLRFNNQQTIELKFIPEEKYEPTEEKYEPTEEKHELNEVNGILSDIQKEFLQEYVTKYENKQVLDTENLEPETDSFTLIDDDLPMIDTDQNQDSIDTIRHLTTALSNLQKQYDSQLNEKNKEIERLTLLIKNLKTTFELGIELLNEKPNNTNPFTLKN
jgi:hypothetical protein